MGLSLLAALVQDPGEGRNPDMSDWETQVMEEGERKEKVFFSSSALKTAGIGEGLT